MCSVKWKLNYVSSGREAEKEEKAMEIKKTYHLK